MNAAPLIRRIALALARVKLEAVLVGNAAAALHGAPVSTLDFDFMFRKTRNNLAKLRALADQLGAVIMRPFYPASDLYRLVDDASGLQIDFLSTLHGIRSFEGLRQRATRIDFDGAPLLVSSLEDIIRSKRAAGRGRDRAVLEILEKTLVESKKKT